MTKYTIRFDYPEATEPLFARLYKGAAGWAPTLSSAWLWDEREHAESWLKNGYMASEYGTVIEVEAVA